MNSTQVEQTIIFTFKRESGVLKRINFPSRTDWQACLDDLLDRESTKYEKYSKYAAFYKFTYRQSDVKTVAVEGVFSYVLTVFLPG